MVREIKPVPDSCVRGEAYLWQIKCRTGEVLYREVIFVDYKPHPGEVLIRDGSAVKRIYRVDLFIKNGLAD